MTIEDPTVSDPCTEMHQIYTIIKVKRARVSSKIVVSSKQSCSQTRHAHTNTHTTTTNQRKALCARTHTPVHNLGLTTVQEA